MRIVQSLFLAVVALFGVSMAQFQFRGPVSTSDIRNLANQEFLHSSGDGIGGNFKPSPTFKPTSAPTSYHPPTQAPSLPATCILDNLHSLGCVTLNTQQVCKSGPAGSLTSPGTVFGLLLDRTGNLIFASCDLMDISLLNTNLAGQSINFVTKTISTVSALGTQTATYAYRISPVGQKG